jgi:2',3'-cyclic-nucleotide 2'-phosphodiesterase (5'-nucleotidase family)
MRLGHAATGSILTLLGLVVLSLARPPLALAQDRTAVILSTSSVAGETVSCGCKSKDFGGLARRATVIAEERAMYPDLLLVDAGDFGSPAQFEPWARTAFVWEMMAALGYDAVTIGPNEMTAGLEPLQELLATAPGIAVVSANVTDKQGNHLWPGYVILEKGGITYGVTGATDGAYYKFNLTRDIQTSDDFSFENTRTALERVLPEMQDVDVVVALLQMSTGDARRVTEGIAGIDVVVVGHNPGYTYAPERVADTFYVRSGSRGQYVGTLHLNLDEDVIVDYDGRGVPLSEAVREEEELKALVTEFNTSYDNRKSQAKAQD